MALGGKDSPEPPGLRPEDEFLALCHGLKSLCPAGFSGEIFRGYWKAVFAFVEAFRLTASRHARGGLEASRLEALLDDLSRSQNALNLRLLGDELARLDEGPLIEGKKRAAAASGDRLKIYRSAPRTLVTSTGLLEFERTSLMKSRAAGGRGRAGAGPACGGASSSGIPAGGGAPPGPAPPARPKAAPPGGWGMSFPLDEAMGIDALPFKITAGAMLVIARHAASSLSFKAARRSLARECFIDITSVTIRSVANTLGALVLKTDLEAAVAVRESWGKALSARCRAETGGTRGPGPRAAAAADPPRVREDDVSRKPAGDGGRGSGAVCIALSEAPIRLRAGPGAPPPPERILLAVVFRRIPLPGNGAAAGAFRGACAAYKEHVPFIGPLEAFKGLVLAAALRAGLHDPADAAIVTDGSSWVEGIRDELFPGAPIALDRGIAESEIRRFADAVSPGSPSRAERIAVSLCRLVTSGRIPQAVEAARKLSAVSEADARRRLLGFLRRRLPAQSSGYWIPSGAGGPPPSATVPQPDACERRERAWLEARLRQSGMRWTAEAGQNILSLAAKHLSGLWERDVEERVIARYGSSPPGADREAGGEAPVAP
ncbi:MAG: hypothetical protein LBG06_02235 [Deltaproteobacteria bacterium]|jgi:hypothetical protein|nr:hypothetical protein [Deltaproteobacteria bacterium]